MARRVGRREWLAAVAAVAGLGLLAAMSAPQGSAAREGDRSGADVQPSVDLPGGSERAAVLRAGSVLPLGPAQTGGYVVADTWLSGDDTLSVGSFRAASGVAVAADGRAYVADAPEGRVSVIEPDESVDVLVPSATGPDALAAPGHLAVDALADRLYVADPGAGAVAVFDFEGRRVATWSDLGRPAGLDIAPDGTVVVADSETGEVVRFDGSGRRVAAWQATGPGLGGDLLRGLDVDSTGKVYVVLGGDPRVAVFTSTGSPVESVRVVPPGAPARVADVHVDEDPRGVGPTLLWFATSRGLLRYEPSRDVWTVNPLGDDLTALAVDRSLGVWVAFEGGPPTGGRLLRLPYMSATDSSSGRAWSGTVLVPGVLDGPEALSIGADARAYVLDHGSRVQRFGTDGAVQGQIDRLNPASATAGVDGTLFVTDGGLLRAYAATDWVSGRPAESWSVSVAPGDGDANAVALAFDASAGEVVVLDALAGAVRRFGRTGGRGALADLPRQVQGAESWADLDLSPGGTAYVLDRGTDAVLEVSTGAPARRIPLGEPARRLAVGSDGSLFTLGRDGWVRRYDAGGTLTAAFDATRFDAVTRSSPSDLDVDAAGDVLVADRDADLVTRFRWDWAAQPGTPPERGAQCRHYPDKVAAPNVVDLGATVEVRLTVRGGCGSDTTTEPLDVILVLDRSGSMDGERLRVLKGAAQSFLSEMDFATTRMAVVAFNDQAELLAGLTDDPARLRRAIVDLTAEGDTRIDRGIAEARAELGRRGRSSARPVFVVLSDGGSDLESAVREAALAKSRGVEVFAVGIQAWERLMRSIATDEDHYFGIDGARFLYGVFERIAQRVTTSVLYRTIDVVDSLPANMVFVPGSDEPAGAWDAASRTLRWSIADVPFNGLALRYRVEPREAGDWPTNTEAHADYVDGFGAAGRLSFPVPRVLVVAPTPTPGGPSPTPIRSPTATPTATPRPTLPPEPIYLPLGLRERCMPGQKRADVMLVVDTSSSMEGDKLDAAKRAATLFVDLMALPEDRVGLVSFDSDARLENELTGDAARLRQVVASLRTHVGTRIDLGLASAREELAGPRHDADRSAVIVLLTDGRQDDADPVLAEARLARDQGVVLFAVGLGQDVDAELLARVAGSVGQTYLAPQPTDLEDIYRRIAVQVPCPPEKFWGRR